MKVRIAVGLGATALDADTFAAVVSALGPLGFDSLWISEVLTGQARIRPGSGGPGLQQGGTAATGSEQGHPAAMWTWPRRGSSVAAGRLVAVG